MEAPPLSTHPPITAPSPSPPAAYPPSVDSSPRSRHNDPWEAEPPPPFQPSPKLRLMCSYGGHIVPRPHDKALCYIGGDTRIIVIDRHTTLSDLHHRLSKSLLQNEPFSLKYQLPTEDLDSLISVSTDEDLENMVEEYDRLNSAVGASKPGRIRFFLFPKSFSGIEQLLVETASIKSEDWFFDTLNGKSSLSAAATDREFSETSSVNCLLGLDDDSVVKAAAAAAVEKDVEAQTEVASKIVGNNGNRNFNVNYVVNQDVQSVPDSPMLETTSSFGSASSSPFVANLPPIRVRVDESPKMGIGIEDQFQQMSVGVAGNVNLQKHDEAGGIYAGGVALASGFPAAVGIEYSNRLVSEDERSDHGGCRKVQQIQPQVHDQQIQPQPIPQFHQKQSNAFDLPSPDSVSSDGSLTNSLSRQRQAMHHQEPLIQIPPGNNIDDQTKLFPGQFDQTRPHLHQPQQYVHLGNQYIPAGAVPITSYYPMFRSQQQQQHHPVLDHQYQQIYVMPTRQNQSYNPPGHHHSYGELAPTVPSTRPQMPPPTVHHQAQYVGYAPICHPSQSMAPSSGANSTYAYEFADTANTQMYYTPLPPQLAAQYQTLTSAPAEGVKQQGGNPQP